MNIEKKIVSLDIGLPAPAKPVGAYVPVQRAGTLVFTAGSLPFENGEIRIKGKLGEEISIEEGYKAARICVLNALSSIKQEIGSLNKIKKIIRLNGYVQSSEVFFDQPKVLNGASDLIASIFGKQGRHTRTAIGVASLPLNSPVELDLIVEVKK